MKLDLRSRLVSNLDWRNNLGRTILFGMAVLTFVAFISFLNYTYLDFYKISGPIFATLMLVYVGVFGLLFITFNSYLIRFYRRRKRRFLRIYEVISHPLINLFVLSFLFLLKFTIGAGTKFNPSLDLLAGCWMISSAFFIIYVSFYWLRSFERETFLFQIVWISHVVYKRIKLYLFTSVLLILGYFSIFLIPYSLGFYPTQETILALHYFGTILAYHFLIFIAILSVTIFIVYLETRKYCKIGLKLIEKRLFSKKVRKEILTHNEEYICVFPNVINQINNLLKWIFVGSKPMGVFSADYPPHIINKDLYSKKLLVANLVQKKQRLNLHDKQRLRDVKNGLSNMRRSLDMVGDRFFYPLIGGLTQIANSGETEARFNIEDGFELKPPSFTMRLEKRRWLIELLLATLLVVLTILGFIIGKI